MNPNQSHYTVAELVQRIDTGELTVNRKYQRSPKVWPETARSFLVETVILGFPVPKLMLWERTNVDTLKTKREIVDGQQRTFAIYDYIKGKYALSNTVETDEIRGKLFQELDVGSKTRLVTYALGVDLLVGSEEAEVRDIFRRLNSYTVPLNPEEQRHAKFQGTFKWFLFEVAKECSSPFQRLGVFDPNSFVRMRDTKLLAEIVHAIENGISTTNKSKLDQLYKSHDGNYPHQVLIDKLIKGSLERIEELDVVKGTDLAKPYNMYSLLLAMSSVIGEETLNLDQPESGRKLSAKPAEAKSKLLALANALDLDEDEDAGPLSPFVEACNSKTNTRENRIIRFNYFYRALTRQPLF